MLFLRIEKYIWSFQMILFSYREQTILKNLKWIQRLSLQKNELLTFYFIKYNNSVTNQEAKCFRESVICKMNTKFVVIQTM